MMASNWSAFLITFMLSVLTVEGVKWLASVNKVTSQDARKIMHIAVGPVFVLCWPLFPDGVMAKWWAATVPLIITLNFVGVGTGLFTDPATVKAMSRNNDRREILWGPLQYGIIFIASTVLYWRQMTGIMSLMVLCAGDGMADVVGRRIGRAKLPWSPDKSWAGSAAFFLASVACGAFFYVFAASQGWPGTWMPLAHFTWPRLVSVSLVAAAVESLPFRDIDNAIVFLATAVTDTLLFS